MAECVDTSVRTLRSLSLCWVVLGLLVAGPVRGEEKPTGLRVGAKAPNFNLNRLVPGPDGETRVRLYDLVGKGDGPTRLVVLTFFATWCKPCRAEVPILQRLHEKHGKAGVKVLSIVVEGPDDRPQPKILEDVRAFLKEHKVTFPVLYDPFMKDVVAGRYLGPQMELPGVYLIDAQGIVRRAFHEKREDLPAQVDAVLQESSGK